MSKVISALTARTHFGQIMKRANQNGERFLVGRRGEPQVVILGIKDYIKLAAPESEVLKIITEKTKRKGLKKLTEREIQAKISAAPGKEFLQALKDLREDAKKKGTNKLTMREINAEIAAYRKEKQEKDFKQLAK